MSAPSAPLAPMTTVLVGVPLLLVVGRLPGMPTAHALDAALDLSTLAPPLRAHVHQVLFVPLGALVVVLARLTLGLRALGVLSPILIAMALPVTGVLPGLAFVTGVLAVATLLVRPMLRSHGLPYSARVAALLSTVAILMLIPLLVLRALPWAGAAEFASFPVVALGLVTERFAATRHREGLSVTTRRTLVTMGEAVVIATLADRLHGVDLLMHHPELLLTQVWCVVMISSRLSLRLAERRHQPPSPSTAVRTKEPVR